MKGFDIIKQNWDAKCESKAFMSHSPKSVSWGPIFCFCFVSFRCLLFQNLNSTRTPHENAESHLIIKLSVRLSVRPSLQICLIVCQHLCFCNTFYRLTLSKGDNSISIFYVVYICIKYEHILCVGCFKFFCMKMQHVSCIWTKYLISDVKTFNWSFDQDTWFFF